MSNIYQFAYPTFPYFQVPHALDQWLNSITIEELRLLLLVHSQAQKDSVSHVPLTPDFICAHTGIHKTNISRVRRHLEEYGLLLTTKHGKDSTYIVCHPVTGKPMPDKTSVMQIDYKTAGPEKLLGYFQTFMPDARLSEDAYKAHCPLPHHPDTHASFQFYPKHGGWSCRGCGKKGNLMDLEIAMSENAAGDVISPSEAHSRIDRKLRKLGCGNGTKGKLVHPSDIVFAYTDEEGEVIWEVVRPKGKKDKMYQRRPDPLKPGRYIYDTKGCRNVLFNLPAICEADTVICVEGEPDAVTLTKLNLLDDVGAKVAVTTNANGANSWTEEHSHTLKNKRVIICGDTNEAGLNHVAKLRASLTALGVPVIEVNIPPKYNDVSAFLKEHRVQDFIDLVPTDWIESVETEETRPVAI
jgi:hypothetical protein